jgi:SPP1 family predicted phage head-tail adaptor
MQAGRLRERVQVQRATATRDAYNAEVLTWATVATVWAQVLERGGREPVLADRPVMLISYEVTVRDGLEITHADRLLWRSKTLSIETVTPVQADGVIILRCLEATV